MQRNIIWASFAGLLSFSSTLFAQDLTGIWQQIDDKTGSPKALIDIRKEQNGTFTGKITKITPRPGYTPREKCVDCPSPYTNQPILGLDVFKNLKSDGAPCDVNPNKFTHDSAIFLTSRFLFFSYISKIFFWFFSAKIYF